MALSPGGDRSGHAACSESAGSIDASKENVAFAAARTTAKVAIGTDPIIREHVNQLETENANLRLEFLNVRLLFDFAKGQSPSESKQKAWDGIRIKTLSVE